MNYDRHLKYWLGQPVDVYLVIRQKDEMSGEGTIRWMNVTRYLRARKEKKCRQIIFEGEKLDMEAVWKVRDGFFPKVWLTRSLSPASRRHGNDDPG